MKFVLGQIERELRCGEEWWIVWYRCAELMSGGVPRRYTLTTSLRSACSIICRKRTSGRGAPQAVEAGRKLSNSGG